jgi:hypothetical protein
VYRCSSIDKCSSVGVQLQFRSGGLATVESKRYVAIQFALSYDTLVEQFDHRLHSGYYHANTRKASGRRRYKYNKTEVQQQRRPDDDEDANAEEWAEHPSDDDGVDSDMEDDYSRSNPNAGISGRTNHVQSTEVYMKTVCDILELDEELKIRDQEIVNRQRKPSRSSRVSGKGSSSKSSTPVLEDQDGDHNDEGGEFSFDKDNCLVSKKNNNTVKQFEARDRSDRHGAVKCGSGSSHSTEPFGPYRHSSTLLCVRRMRLITIGLEVSDNVDRLMKYADVHTISALLIRQALKCDWNNGFRSIIVKEDYESSKETGKAKQLLAAPGSAAAGTAAQNEFDYEAESVVGRYDSSSITSDNWSTNGVNPLSSIALSTDNKKQMAPLLSPTKADYCLRRQSMGIRSLCDWCVSMVCAAAQRKLTQQMKSIVKRGLDIEPGTSVDVEGLVQQVRQLLLLC